MQFIFFLAGLSVLTIIFADSGFLSGPIACININTFEDGISANYPDGFENFHYTELPDLGPCITNTNGQLTFQAG